MVAEYALREHGIMALPSTTKLLSTFGWEHVKSKVGRLQDSFGKAHSGPYPALCANEPIRACIKASLVKTSSFVLCRADFLFFF
jgi:hypothetical protein